MTRPPNPLNIPGYQARDLRTPPRGYCGTCYEKVIRVRMMLAGREIPVDPVQDPDGNICVSPGSVEAGKPRGFVIGRDGPPKPGWLRYHTHWSVCAR